MKKIIYLYVLDTMAEWEVGSILQAIGMKNLIKNASKDFEVITVGPSIKTIKTLGGLTITPDISVKDMDESKMVALLLPGAETWAEQKHERVLEKAFNCYEKGILVGAICGATLALSNYKLLDKIKHTSNSLSYLQYFSKDYKGEANYFDAPAVRGGNLITASAAGGLLWAKYILEALDVYKISVIEAWYAYYNTGNSSHFTQMLDLGND